MTFIGHNGRLKRNARHRHRCVHRPLHARILHRHVTPLHLDTNATVRCSVARKAHCNLSTVCCSAVCFRRMVRRHKLRRMLRYNLGAAKASAD